jgi:Mce-associated membrane protein
MTKLITKPRDWYRWTAYVLLPAAAGILAIGAIALKLVTVAHSSNSAARAESLQAARAATVAMLTYSAATVEQDLNNARSKLTSPFLDDYTKLINTQVIPSAKEKQTSAAAQVPALASVSVKGSHAVALVFVDQTIASAKDPATTTASTIRVTLDKVDGHWLVSGFDPV